MSPNEIEKSEPVPGMVFAPDLQAEPMDLVKVNEQVQIMLNRVPAENLVDQRFVIMEAHAYQSSFQVQDHVYYCKCYNEQTGEWFGTSLGGQAVVDVLDALVKSGWNQPLRVTLRKVNSGQYGGYYILE